MFRWQYQGVLVNAPLTSNLRARFERWAESRGWNTGRKPAPFTNSEDRNGRYANAEVDNLWDAWQAASSLDETKCDATWQPIVGGPIVPCTLPAGHKGKHRSLEPFEQEDNLLGVTRPQMDWATAVTREAMLSGMTKQQFLTMVSIGWDAREQARSAQETSAQPRMTATEILAREQSRSHWIHNIRREGWSCTTCGSFTTCQADIPSIEKDCTKGCAESEPDGG